MSSGKLFKFLKNFTQILLSVSFFSFLFSQSSLFPVFLHYFNHFAPKFPVNFFTFESQRNYIFLLCNGILFLIIKTSGLVRKSPAKVAVDLTHPIQQKKEEEPKFDETQIHEEGRQNGGFGAARMGDRGRDFHGSDQTEEWAEDEEEIEVLSADELNKKCEEFIKKVRQEIQKS